MGGGTDNIGTDLINYALYSSANVDFNSTSVQIQDGQPHITQTFAYAESMSLITLRSVATAVAYIVVFLVIAWIAVKRAQVLE